MIIGVVGFAGSGKGTVGDLLVSKYSFNKLSFADAVKDAVSAIFGWPRHLLEGDTDESRAFRECRDPFWSERFGYDVTPRYMMQLMGTEAGRDVFHNDVWIHVVEHRIERMIEDGHGSFVIPDVRFPNEIEAIHRMGGHVIRVVRGEEPEWFEAARRANTEKNTDLMSDYIVHYSEWAWIGEQFDYVIHNNSSLMMLEADVDHMLRVFTGPKNSDIIKAA